MEKLKNYDNNYKKEKWKAWEDIVAKDYEKNWYTILERNYYKKWAGELDIVAENKTSISFIEVKNVDWIDDLFDYISKKKISRIKKTMSHYLMENPTEKDIQIDIVFVKNGKIFEAYKNITF